MNGTPVSSTTFTHHELAALRKKLRSERRQLDPLTRKKTGRTVSRIVFKQVVLRRAKNIALYLACDGEVDLTLLINRLWRAKRKCFLPMVVNKREKVMLFAPYTDKSPMQRNHYGIREPKIGRRQMVKARQLDYILAPLVGFDSEGNRLGMGGGYYDRALGFTMPLNHCSRPKFIGIAHAFQEVNKLPARSWDVAMRAVVTEQGMRSFL